MVHHTALRILTASAGARIPVPEVHTSLRRRAFRVENALRPTFRRITQVARYAGTDRTIAYFPALTVWTARSRSTRSFVPSDSDRSKRIRVDTRCADHRRNPPDRRT